MPELTDIVERNLGLCLSSSRGGMHHLLMFESYGGNGGAVNGYTCAWANFSYDIQGYITSFSNTVNKDESQASFRVSLDARALQDGQLEIKIVEIHFACARYPVAQDSIRATAWAYNSRK